MSIEFKNITRIEPTDEEKVLTKRNVFTVSQCLAEVSLSFPKFAIRDYKEGIDWLFENLNDVDKKYLLQNVSVADLVLAFMFNSTNAYTLDEWKRNIKQQISNVCYYLAYNKCAVVWGSTVSSVNMDTLEIFYDFDLGSAKLPVETIIKKVDFIRNKMKLSVTQDTSVANAKQPKASPVSMQLPGDLIDHLSKCKGVEEVVSEVCKYQMMAATNLRINDTKAALVTAWNVTHKN